MKLTTTAFVVAMMGASAWAQMANPAQTINNVRSQLRSATNAVNERREQTVNQAAQPTSQVAPRTQVTPGKPGVSQMEVKRGKAAAQHNAAAAAETTSGGTVQMRGKRDPFVSVIRTQSAAGGTCATGKKCLVIGEIALKGIVRSGALMIAVVENAQRKTYFLHENDPVFNGHVVKIDPDGIVFRETVIDRVGRQSTREVVKRILKPSIS
jgi:hypothetical protein